MNPQDEKGKIWFSGRFVDWKDATVHVMSHVLHYGSAVFEGLRCYDTARGPAAFRLMEHVRRLFDSAKIYRMEIPFTRQQVFDACLETIRVNKLRSAYLRPIAFRGYNTLGVDPTGCPVEVVIGALSWGKYLGDEAINQGVDVRVSSWSRIAPNTFPAMAKCGANYMNSQLIKMEAISDGYVEGIALDVNGYVSEGSGENVFIIRDGKIITPPLGASVLPGITRDSVITIAREMEIPVCEQLVPRELLYIADEVFFTGSAAEVSPIRSIDKIPIGSGSRGPITEKIQRRFFDIIEGKVDDPYGWLTFVYNER
ncbi:MAG: branched-chain amino acid transaminase [Candidatus Zixiibacteriota bacterium]|nr:MAG: branched-chain amino acid transaminase [candidate division Zixibacteria bacterium]